MILIQVGNKMRWMKRILALCMAAVIAAGLSTPLTAEAAPVPVIRGGLHFYSWDEKDKTKCYIRMTRQNITAIEYRVYSSGGKLKKTASSVVARDPDSKYQICTVKGLTARSRNYVSVRIKKAGSAAWSKWSSKFPIIPYHRAGQVKSSANVAKRTYTLSWKKISGVSSYEVYISQKENGGWVKVASTKKNKVTIKTFKNKPFKLGRVYFVRVVCVSQVGDKKIRSCGDKAAFDQNLDFCLLKE